jgi:hypothetical protein
MTEAWLGAYADQLQALQRDTAARIRAHHGEAAAPSELTPGMRGIMWRIWGNLGGSVVTGRTKPCPLLAAAMRTSPLPATRVHWLTSHPGHLVCDVCTGGLRQTPVDPVEDTTCDNCRTVAEWLHNGMFMLGPVAIYYGLCCRCMTLADAHGPCGRAKPRNQRKIRKKAKRS